MLFSDFKLKNWLLKALWTIGYDEPTPIQAQVLEYALQGKNIVWQSQTGTWKTTAFLLPLLQRIDTNEKGTHALILAPTRELVTQIGEEIFALTKFYRVNSVCVYWGASMNEQLKKLNKWPWIIVATPGRLMDFVGQKVIDLSSIKFFVLDEVDRMLDMWFIRDIEKIRNELKNVKQTFTFSATLNDKVQSIIKKHVQDYEFVKVAWKITVDKIHHRYMHVSHDDKIFNLKKLIDAHEDEKIIIFTHTKRNTEAIFNALLQAKLDVSMLHGDMRQSKRRSTLELFKTNNIQILVTTDVTARGLNMDNIDLVINFDVPNEAESYIHRIGRTWRAGQTGKAIMLVDKLEIPLLKNIELTNKITINQSEYMSIPDKSRIFSHIKLDRSTDKRWGQSFKRPKTPSSWYTNPDSKTSNFRDRQPRSWWKGTGKKRGFRWAR